MRLPGKNQMKFDGNQRLFCAERKKESGVNPF